jgi:hypothetical protein
MGIVAFFATPIGKKIGVGIIVVLAIAAAYSFAYNNGRQAGESSGRRAGQEEIRKDALADRAAHEAESKANREAQATLVEALARSSEALANSNSAIASIQTAAIRDRAAVSKVSDAGLFADITQKLEMRPASDTSTSFTFPELRKIDLLITDYPHKVDEIKAKDNKIEALSGTVEDQKQLVAAVTKDRDQEHAYGVRTFANYASAYNLASKKPFWLLRLFGYKGKHIDLPKPETVAPAK